MNYKVLFIGLFILGMALCTRGIGRVAANADWLSPFALLGYLFGTLAVALFIAVVFNVKIPYISSNKEAMLVLVGIIAVKFLIGLVYRMFK